MKSTVRVGANSNSGAASPHLASPSSLPKPQPTSASGTSASQRKAALSISPPTVMLAGLGDFPAIHQLLLTTFHTSAARELQAFQDGPLFEPSDRLVVKSPHGLLGHVYLANQLMHFGPLQLSTVKLSQLAVSPDVRGRKIGTALLAVADRKLATDGAVLGRLLTDRPEFFQRHGWVPAGRHCYSQASAREILAQLRQEQTLRAQQKDVTSLLEEPAKSLSIRLWRHVEQAALDRLYRENTANSYGALARGDMMWRWLVGRNLFDRIYVAISGRDRMEIDDSRSSIVGYAVMRQGRILELMVKPGHATAAEELLARACGDAIEQDYHTVRLDAPADHPLHRVMKASGGKFHWHEAEHGMVQLMKLVSPLGFLRSLAPLLGSRVKAAGIKNEAKHGAKHGTELGLKVAGKAICVSIGPRSVRIAQRKLPRSYLTCGQAEFTQLLLGHLDVEQAVTQGRIAASTRLAVDSARLLFPRLPLWTAPLDDLQG